MTRTHLRTRRAGVAALTLGLALALGACGDGDDDAGMDHGSMGQGDGDDSSDEDSQDEPNMADLMFVQMMVPHHEQAVEMSAVVLAADGVSAEVRDLATQIREAQQPEIEQMEGWLDAWGNDMNRGMEGMGDAEGMSSDGMLDGAEMQALQEASGPEVQELFLEGMIEHHQGAIDMAEQEIEEGAYPPALELAERIIDTQQAEIDHMEDLLR